MAMLLALFGFLPFGALGHGVMQFPPSWYDAKGEIGMQAGRQCDAGCDLKINITGEDLCSCMWFTNYTHITVDPTLPAEMRTFQDIQYPGFDLDWTKTFPWRAPGRAKLHSPCGLAGGNPDGCPYGDSDEHTCPGGGWAYGPDAIEFDFPDVVETTWKAGSVVEAAWGMTANHGGGYSYRLCKLTKEGKPALTEECFQKTQLDFHGDTQWVQFGLDPSTRQSFKANRTRAGTYPENSQWTKNPVPACVHPAGGYYDAEKGCPEGTQFDRPLDFLAGSGVRFPAGYYPSKSVNDFYWSIVDTLKVPADLEPGKYVLSFRWDCEQSPQVWNTCADIRIEA